MLRCVRCAVMCCVALCPCCLTPILDAKCTPFDIRYVLRACAGVTLAIMLIKFTFSPSVGVNERNFLVS